MLALFVVGVLLLSGCGANDETAAVTSERVESYLRALASGDQAMLHELSYAEDVGDLGLARREAFGSEEPTSVVGVKVGASLVSDGLGSIGGDAGGDLLVAPAIITMGDGRKLHLDVQVWIPSGKPSSIGPAYGSD